MTSQAMRRYFDMTCVQKHITTESGLRSIPARSLNGFFLEPWAFDCSENAKYGAVGRYPSNHQYSLHFPSFLERGLETHREAIDVKFTLNTEDLAQLHIHPWSVGYVDGQTKVLILQSILTLLHHLDTCLALYNLFFFEGSLSSCHLNGIITYALRSQEIAEDQLEEDEEMCKVIASFRFIRCNYKKHDNPEYFLYESLCFCLSLYHQTESEQWGDAGQTSSQKHLVFSDSMASTRPCQQNG